MKTYELTFWNATVATDTVRFEYLTEWYEDEYGKTKMDIKIITDTGYAIMDIAIEPGDFITYAQQWLREHKWMDFPTSIYTGSRRTDSENTKIGEEYDKLFNEAMGDCQKLPYWNPFE